MVLPMQLLARLEEQRGVFTTAQAIEAGLVGHELGRLRVRRHLHRLRRGVWTTAQGWEEASSHERHLLEARAVVMHLQEPFVLSHVTAAVAHGLPLHRVSTATVHVTRPGRPSATRTEAGVCHHTGPVPDPVTLDGLPVTDLARTVLDLARTTGEASAVVAMDAALNRGLDPQRLVDLLAACERWPGVRAAGRAFRLADGRSESVGETLTRLACVAVGLPPDQLQLAVSAEGHEYETDFAWTEHGVVGEFDGKVKYGRLLRPGQTSSDALVAERQRELRIERAGWDVVRFTWAEIHDLPLVRARLLETFARRGPTRHRAEAS